MGHDIIDTMAEDSSQEMDLDVERLNDSMLAAFVAGKRQFYREQYRKIYEYLLSGYSMREIEKLVTKVDQTTISRAIKKLRTISCLNT